MKYNRRYVGNAGLMAGFAMALTLGHGSAAMGRGVDGKALYERVSPSFVAVQFVWENENRRAELAGVGVVISEDGLVMVPLSVVSPVIPDEQLKEFKIILPRLDRDHEELDAVFVGRDERSELAFVKLKDPGKKLKPIKFVDKQLVVGQSLMTVGMMPKDSGYKTYLTDARVATQVRGVVHAYIAGGDLANVGGVVFDDVGDAVGYVQAQQIGPQQQQSPVFLQDPRMQIFGSLRYFVPASEVLPGIAKPPTQGTPTPMPFVGLFGLSGLSKDVAEVFNLSGTPAIEVGEVIPASPAAIAGMTKKMIITELDGQPLERGDEPEELGPIMEKKIDKKAPGDVVEFTVVSKGDAPKKIKVTLGTRPAERNLAKRYFVEDLGFVARESVFEDFYARKLLGPDGKPTRAGLVVDFIKQQSAAATARLKHGDLILQLNSAPVSDVPTFKTAIEQFRKEKPKEAIVLQVLREGATEIVRIEAPQ